MHTAPFAAIDVVADGVRVEAGEADASGIADVALSAGDGLVAWLDQGETRLHHGALDLRPGDRVRLALPYAADSVLPEPLGLILPEGLPEGGVGTWVGLFECAGGRPVDAGYEVGLGRCEGLVTPVAVALDGGGHPLAFQRLDGELAADLAGVERQFDGVWRTDWAVVRLDVETAADEVYAELLAGGWLHYEVHPAAPFSIAFRLPPGVEVAARLKVERLTEQLAWHGTVWPGDHVVVDFAEAPIPEAVSLSADARRLEGEGIASAWLEAVAPGESWQLRAPMPAVGLPWALDLDALDGGYVAAELTDLPYDALREAGDSAEHHWRQRVVLAP